MSAFTRENSTVHTQHPTGFSPFMNFGSFSNKACIMYAAGEMSASEKLMSRR